MVEKLSIGGQDIKRGQRTVVALPVTVDLDGNHITIYAHVLAGVKPGPTLALLSMLHGSEWQSMEVVKRVLDELDPADMSGNLIAVPVCNPVAFGQLTRNTPDESDRPDLNRVFPGGGHWTSIASQIASVIAREVMAPADAMIDFHLMSAWGQILVEVVCGIDYPDPEVVASSQAMARAFGVPSIHEARVVSSHLGPRCATGYFSGVLGRPAISAEVGGAGFRPSEEEKWVQANVRGITNVMKHMGILKGEQELPPERFLVWEDSSMWVVNPSKGGYLIPAVEPERLMGEVQKGELLGTVISPYTFEELERLEAPGRGVLFYCSRTCAVRPGDWAFGVVDLEDPSTRWESPIVHT